MTEEQPKKNLTPIVPNEFNIKNLEFGDFEESSFNKAQNLSMPKYTDPEVGERPLIIQTPWLPFNVHGITRKSEFYKTDDDRDFLKIPLDVKRVPKAQLLRDNVLLPIDKKLGSKDFKVEKFGADGVDDHIYRPIVRLPVIPKQPKGSKPYVPPPPKPGNAKYEKIDKMKVEFFKAKLSYKYPSKSEIEEGKKKDKKSKKKDDSDEDSDKDDSDSDAKSKKKKGKKGKDDDEEEGGDGERKKFKINKDRVMNTKIVHRIGGKSIVIPCKNISDIEKACPFGSTVRYVVRMGKVGVMKSADNYGNYPYNAGWTLLLMQIKPREGSGGAAMEINENSLAIDSEDDDEIKSEKKSKKGKKGKNDSDSDAKSKKNDKNKKKQLDSDESSEETPKPKKKPTKDSDDSEDEKPKPKPKPKKKDSDDDSEDEKPKPKSKDKPKKKDSDDDSEEEKPQKKKKPVKDSDDDSD